jgi:hypothetical protein
MQINSSTNIVPKNRNALILVIILAVLIIVLIGILYFTKQQNLGEGGGPGISNSKVIPQTHTLSELRELTSAPENNPDIKPNPVLTALTTSTESTNQITANPSLIDNLTAPKN